jgi:hypothetical protein
MRSPGILYGTAWKKDATESLVRTAILQGFLGIDGILSLWNGQPPMNRCRGA